MNSQHFDIGTIQAFLDGELSHERVDAVASHVAACDNCAMMLAEAEDESAIVFSALEREFDTLVPTQRLWNKINDSITVEKANEPFWKKAWAFASTALASPSIAVAASVLIVFGIVATFWIGRGEQPAPLTAVNTPKATIRDTETASVTPKVEAKGGDTITSSLNDIPRVERAAYQPVSKRAAAPTVVKASTSTPPEGLPGEESYIKTIATLSKSVEDQMDGMMRPSERVAYERDMAVVNDSISKMRREVKRNPKNESAKQVLYSSYQNKIDLLNSVSQKEELMASLD